MSLRPAIAVCAAATVLVAGAGAVYASHQNTTPQNTGPDPVVTVLPAHAPAPPSGDPLAVAQAHLQRARQTDDPREDSYAEGALAPLFASGTPPLPALFLRGVLAQRRHDFAAATKDLEAVLTSQPKNPDARLTLAFVQLATGQAEAAETTCKALEGAASVYVQDACLSSTWTRLGRGHEALARLQRWTAATDSGLSPDELAWLFSLQAETAEALGAPDTEATYRRSLQLDPTDRYTRVALADFLLDAAQPQAALDLLKSAPGDETDSLLLRRGLALHDLHADATAPATLLGARFDAMTQRGDPLHLREEVRYRVAFDPSATPDHLLDLAVRNYAIQKEPWDARVLLEACVRAGHRTPCDAVNASMASFEHPRIRALRAQLGTVAP